MVKGYWNLSQHVLGNSQKVTERSRMMVTIQNHMIHNTFNRQSTKTILYNILSASMHMLLNVLKFWCYDPHLPLPDQTRFSCFLFVHQFLIHNCISICTLDVFWVSSAYNCKQTSCFETKNASFAIQVSFFFSFFFFSEWN